MCRKASVPFLPGGHSKMYTPGTIANSQTQKVPTKINKNGTVAKVYKNFSGTRDTIRHLKTFRVISNEMPVLLLILSCCYFSCLKVYCIIKYSGQKRLFLPHAPNFKTFISSLFFYFRKICSRHHCHHFHLHFYYTYKYWWGRWFFVKSLEKDDLNIKHFWCGIGWRVFERNPLIFTM